MSLAAVSATGPDLLRLVALPVFAWTAVRDVRTRRVSSAVWIPLALLGTALLVRDGWVARNAGPDAWTYEFLIPATISLGIVVPLAYLFWWVGGFGGADAKALFVLAVLFPTVPQYIVGSRTLPLTTAPIGAFSLTILTNAVLVAVAIPLALAARNAAAGRFGPRMFVGWPVSWDRIPTTHGKLLATPGTRFDGGLDLDALRMYLRWRGRTLAELRDQPARFRDPETLPADPNPPTDGAVTASTRSDGGTTVERVNQGDRSRRDADREYDDPWGVEAFLADVEGTAYGTTPTELREGLEALTTEDRVWVSPGTPFLVPVFVGLVIALVYGDPLFGVFV